MDSNEIMSRAQRALGMIEGVGIGLDGKLMDLLMAAAEDIDKAMKEQTKRLDLAERTLGEVLNAGVVEGGTNVYLCEECAKGQLEMCPYFKEHFLESGPAVRSCPEFTPEDPTWVEVMQGYEYEKAKILTSRCVQKAMAGERAMLLTHRKAKHARALLSALEDLEAKIRVTAVHICLENGGEIVIGGLYHADQ